MKLIVLITLCATLFIIRIIYVTSGYNSSGPNDRTRTFKEAIHWMKKNHSVTTHTMHENIDECLVNIRNLCNNGSNVLSPPPDMTELQPIKFGSHVFKISVAKSSFYVYKAVIIPEFVDKDVYGLKTIKIDEKNEKDCVMLDVGANVGFFSLFAAKLYPKCVVHSFEPMPITYDLLVYNICQNNLTNVCPHKLGVAATSTNNAVKFMQYNVGNSGGSSMFQRDWNDIAKNSHAVKVDTITPTVLLNISKTITYLKLDCEGCEYAFNYDNLDINSMNHVKYMGGEYHHGVYGALSKDADKRGLYKHLKTLKYFTDIDKHNNDTHIITFTGGKILKEQHLLDWNAKNERQLKEFDK